jgi:type II secretory ATPase GspE/PulE/Tfp pilus assembly ATPase PilB-like protein
MQSPHLITDSFLDEFQDMDFTNFESYVVAAFRKGSSDVHFEPLPAEMRIRCRIEGDLYEMARLRHAPGPKKPHPITVQIKARSGLQLQSRSAEDGRFDMLVDDQPLNLRVSSIPQVFGEKLVVRIFNVNRITDLRTLGFRDVNLKRLRDVVVQKSGLILISGPTGSGKTTTLYSVLNYLNDTRRNVVTIEDPVEYFFHGMNQVQVDGNSLTYETALRSILRQDPDVIMIGEIRDKLTAELAFHASLTGHLVLSSVHSNDTVGAILRLLDLGVPPVILAQGLNGVVSQRLVPKLCPECSVADAHPPLDAIRTYAPVGCSHCNGGFRDRVGVQEILILTDTLRKMIIQNFDEEEFSMLALSEGMETLKEDGIFKSIEGKVSYRDALGITSEGIHRILADINRILKDI